MVIYVHERYIIDEELVMSGLQVYSRWRKQFAPQESRSCKSDSQAAASTGRHQRKFVKNCFVSSARAGHAVVVIIIAHEC